MADVSTHPCDAPGIEPRDFLYSVMRDQTMPISTRIDAAEKLLRIYGAEPPLPPWSGVTIKIGGIPPEPTINPSDMCTSLQDCLRRTGDCPWAKIYPHLHDCKAKAMEQMQVAGSA